MYLQDRELNAVLEEYFNEDNQTVSTDLMIPISEGMYYDVLNEAAKYTFLPRIKRDESLKTIWKDCEEAQNLLNTKGEKVDKKTLYKMGDIALRIVRFLREWKSVTSLPFVLFCIPGYLCNRLVVQSLRNGEDELGKKYARKIKSELESAKSKHKGDKEFVKKVDDQIAKIDKSLDTMDKKSGGVSF